MKDRLIEAAIILGVVAYFVFLAAAALQLQGNDWLLTFLVGALQ